MPDGGGAWRWVVYSQFPRGTYLFAENPDLFFPPPEGHCSLVRLVMGLLSIILIQLTGEYFELTFKGVFVEAWSAGAR